MRPLARPILIAVAGVVAALLLTVPAPASRAPTRSESKAIRAAALRSLHGSGWHVSHIRVSSVSGRYHYAKASVDQLPDGAGGEMILRGRSGTWHRVFLGTNDFCDAPIPRRALKDLGFAC